MLIITHTQMAQLNAAFNARYEAQTVKYLQAKYADWAATQNEEQIAAFVSEGVRKAARFGIADSADVTSFLEYCVRYGKEFWKDAAHQWAADILLIRNISGPIKMARMRASHPL
jgi:hypothetical protein